MLGVDDLTESWVVIKFHIKTRPLQQWNVKRELLRRIKNRFDELNIELPFPQRTVHIRDDTGSILPAAPSRILQGLHTPRSSG
jgi:small conductance mechanosensitive channel